MAGNTITSSTETKLQRIINIIANGTYTKLEWSSITISTALQQNSNGVATVPQQQPTVQRALQRFCNNIATIPQQ